MTYIPKTMIGRAGRRVCNNIGKCLAPVDEAVRVLDSVRMPDMELVRRVAAEIHESPVLVDLCWTRMIDAIVSEIDREKQALDEFEKEHAK